MCTGEAREGFRGLAEAAVLVEKSEEQVCELEILQLRGDSCLMLTAPDGRQAEACFRRVIDIARKQGAKSF
jgi:hypothetical protein